MPTYRFEFRDPAASPMSGIEMPSLEAVGAEALNSARDMLIAAALKHQVLTGWAVRVYDEADDSKVSEVFFEDVPADLLGEGAL